MTGVKEWSAAHGAQLFCTASERKNMLHNKMSGEQFILVKGEVKQRWEETKKRGEERGLECKL